MARVQTSPPDVKDVSTSAALRIASVPADHPYVHHLDAPSGALKADAAVVRLPDPPVRAEDGSTRWWPPRMLDAGWVHTHANEFDVLHVHFGFESFSPAHLEEVVTAVHEEGKGLVVTVHDLRNPHLEDATEHLARLDVLVRGADALITLTPGAAAVIEERWGRRAAVIPHPHVVPLDEIPESPHLTPPPQEEARVGVHLKSLRRNVDAVGALRGLALLPPHVRPVVTIHRAVLDPTDRGYNAEVASLAIALNRDGAIDLIAHDPMDDQELHTHLRTLDVSVMPYRWGTHSGWIEMCHDLGLRVVAPDVGYYAEQHAPTLFDLGADERIDPQALADAVLRALDSTGISATRRERHSERVAVARAHADVYRQALSAARRRRPAVRSR